MHSVIVQGQDLSKWIEANNISLDNVSTLDHNLKMYKKAEPGFVRYMITLPKIEQEKDHKIEIYAGKEMEVDCNTHTVAGSFTEKTVKGWGYPYLDFDYKGVLSTYMMCPPESREVKFVRSREQFPKLTRLILEFAFYMLDLFSQKLNLLQFQSATERYHLFLEMYPNLEGRISLGHTASFLGITRQTLSVVRAKKRP